VITFASNDLQGLRSLVMFPFAHSCDDFPPDAEMLMEAGLGVAKAMRTHHGEDYQAGQACDLTYRYNQPLNVDAHADLHPEHQGMLLISHMVSQTFSGHTPPSYEIPGLYVLIPS